MIYFLINHHHSTEKLPIPSEIANNNFCFIIVYEVYGGKSIQLKLNKFKKKIIYYPKIKLYLN